MTGARGLQCSRYTMRRVTILSVLFLAACTDTTPLQEEGSLHLLAEDVSCTEAWFRLMVPLRPQGQTIELVRDGARVQQIRLLSSDTVIADRGLLPRRSYTYQIFRLLNDEPMEASLPVFVTTMDTTSHIFTWQETTLGDGSSSHLHDVAILNDTLAYAVGEIYLLDSSGQIDPIAYSVAIWNGASWQMKRLYYGGTNLISDIRGISAFGATDVWLAAGGVFHWNGIGSQADLVFSRLTLPDPAATIERVWGFSNTQLYGVGNAGTVVFYDGSAWHKLESGTTLDVRDVYGNRNPRTGKEEILAVASSTGSFERKILLLSSAVSDVPDSGLLPFSKLGGVWLVPGSMYVVVGDGVYSRHDLSSDSPWTHYAGVTQFFTPSVRGNGLNDIIVTGVFGELLHFNGFSWHSYRSSLGLTNAVLGSVEIRGNHAIVVGFEGSRALVIVGKR